MKTFKIVLGILLIIPATLIIASIADPKFTMRNPAAEPQIIEKMFNLRKNERD